jgi:hypothetical protein
MDKRPNKALRLTANPLRGLSAAELGRYAGKWQTRGVVLGLTCKDPLSVVSSRSDWTDYGP